MADDSKHRKHHRDHDHADAGRDEPQGSAGNGEPAADGGDGQPTGGADGPAGGNGLAGDGQARAGAGTAEVPPPQAADPAAELAATKDRLLRLAAEFENYRKRVERERSENMVRAQAQLLERLLEPLEDLARIADYDPETTPAGALHEGAEMVEKKFLRAMEAAGLETIEAAGKPFDPTLHEGLTTVPTDKPEEDDTVAQEYQKGYRFKGVLLRPARVVVRKYQG
jgi:molecular chaperone GrpE